MKTGGKQTLKMEATYSSETIFNGLHSVMSQKIEFS
jgi:hypothetical protein